MEKNANKIAFYAPNEDGRFEEVILDLFEKRYEHNDNIKERDLWRNNGGKGREFQAEPDVLGKLIEAARASSFGGSFWDSNISEEEEEAHRRRVQARKRKLVPKEKIRQAIRWECSADELSTLCSYDRSRYEKDNYYDFELIIDKIHAFMAGEQSVNYFTSWLILLMRCFEESQLCGSHRQKEIYSSIADWLDSAAFMPFKISEEERRKNCLELIAVLKDLDHQLKNIEAKKDTPFTKNGVATYVAFDAYICGDEGVELSKVCVADEDNETVNYLFVPNLVYKEEINYTFLTKAEFGRLMSRYYEYTFDGTMKEDYAMTKTNR